MPFNLLRLWSADWPALLGIFVGGLIAAGLYQFGFTAGAMKQYAVQQRLELQWKDQALTAERAYSSKLETVQKEWAQSVSFTAAQSAALAESNRAIQSKLSTLKKDIPNVIQTDAQNGATGGDCVRGLGIDSLRLYTRALGYAD